MTELLEIAVLGGLRLRRGGVPVSEMTLRKAEALFVYLACTGQPRTREELADLLWDERGHEQGLQNLRMVLSDLKPILGSHLLITRAAIAFNAAAPHWLDVAALESHLEAAEIARPRGAAPGPAVVRELEQAVALYAGPFLQGFYIRESTNFENWMLDQQQRLERRILGALDLLITDALESRTYAAGVGYATRLLQLDPLNEEVHRRLMHLLALDGQRHAALEQYATCQRLLESELGLTPAPATTALYEAIRGGQLVALPAPDRPATVASGPERATRLPVQLTPFVGRTAELAALRSVLADPATRLVTVTGLGGSGKTRLTIQAVPELAGFPDGIYFVPLVAVLDPAFLVSAITEALDFPFTGAHDVKDQLFAYLHEKELLLVLDSFEHLQDGAALLVDLLQAAPRVKLLVTSREPLQLSAEQIFDLAGLAVPPAGATQGIERFPAVQLFLTRAQRVLPQFSLDPAVVPWVVQICRLVEGLPLGIELAAGWVRGQSCQAIAEELERGLDVLATPQRDVPARHRSLRAVFDQSWQRLTPAEQIVFRRLAVFRGSFDDAAARAVTAGGPAWPRALLPALVQQSLLRMTPTGRYELHELLRQYARERLEASGELAEITARHSAYYAALADAAVPHLQGPDQDRWLARLEQEHDNVRAALRRAQAGADPALALRLAAALGGFWRVYGYLSEGRQWLTMALAADAAPAGPDRGHAHYWAGVLAREQGDFPEATRHLQAALTLARARDDARETGRCLVELGQVHQLRGENPAARTALEDGLATLRPLDDAAGIATALVTLGLLAFGQGDYPEARHLYEEGLAHQRALGDRLGSAATLLHLGNVAYYEGDYPGAEALYAESLAVDRELGDKQGVAMSLHNLGMLAQDRGDYEAARAYLEEDLALFREMGHKPGIAHSLFTLGQGAYARGDYGAARALLEESLARWREVGNTAFVALALAERGLVAYRQDDCATAGRSLSESLVLCRDLRNRQRAALCLLGLAAIAATCAPRPTGAAQAARLIGAAEGLLAAIRGVLEPAYRSLYSETLRDVRDELGETAFAVEHAAGRALTWPQAIAAGLAVEAILGAEIAPST